MTDKVKAREVFSGLLLDESSAESNLLPTAVKGSECLLDTEGYFIGISTHLKQLRKFVAAQAASQRPVQLCGEAGLQPQHVARMIHQLSGKPQHSFQVVNAQAYTATALYELFYAPGGLVATCQTGTIFLTEAAELPLSLFYRFAIPAEPQPQQARHHSAAGPRLILAVTEPWTKQTRLRDSFEHPLAALQPAVFKLKPLRERSEDLPYLITYLADRIASRLHKGKHHISTDVMTLLTAYDWGGNLDELESVLESIIAHTPPPEISEALLPARIRQPLRRKIPVQGINLFQVVEAYENELIVQALRQTGDKQNAAAHLLGIKPSTLSNRLKRLHGLSPGAST